MQLLPPPQNNTTRNPNCPRSITDTASLCFTGSTGGLKKPHMFMSLNFSVFLFLVRPFKMLGNQSNVASNITTSFELT